MCLWTLLVDHHREKDGFQDSTLRQRVVVAQGHWERMPDLRLLKVLYFVCERPFPDYVAKKDLVRIICGGGAALSLSFWAVKGGEQKKIHRRTPASVLFADSSSLYDFQFPILHCSGV